MPFETLLFEVSDGLAKITLNRPGAANSLNGAMAHDLMMAAIRCDEDPGIRAVLLTGMGKMFCAGGDLKTFHGFGEDMGARLKEITIYLHAATSRFSRMNPPLVVAVNGIAAGAGLSIAISGDLVGGTSRDVYQCLHSGRSVTGWQFNILYAAPNRASPVTRIDVNQSPAQRR